MIRNRPFRRGLGLLVITAAMTSIAFPGLASSPPPLEPPDARVVLMEVAEAIDAQKSAAFAIDYAETRRSAPDEPAPRATVGATGLIDLVTGDLAVDITYATGPVVEFSGVRAMRGGPQPLTPTGGIRYLHDAASQRDALEADWFTAMSDLPWLAEQLGHPGDLIRRFATAPDDEDYLFEWTGSQGCRAGVCDLIRVSRESHTEYGATHAALDLLIDPETSLPVDLAFRLNTDDIDGERAESTFDLVVTGYGVDTHAIALQPPGTPLLP